MGRRMPEELEEKPLPKRRKLPEERKEIDYKTRCFWPCPCGGTVPDAPEYCRDKVYQPKIKGSCTDVQICIDCVDKRHCEAFKKFLELTKTRHREDVRNSNEHHPISEGLSN